MLTLLRPWLLPTFYLILFINIVICVLALRDSLGFLSLLSLCEECMSNILVPLPSSTSDMKIGSKTLTSQQETWSRGVKALPPQKTFPVGQCPKWSSECRSPLSSQRSLRPHTLEGHGDLFHGRSGGCSLTLHWEQRMRKRRVIFYPREDEVSGVEDRELGIPRP